MRLPRITKSIFLDQFIFMQLAGLVIGFTFPKILLWYGLAAEQVLTTEFYILSIVSGQIVGLTSFLLISMVIRPHLKLLSYNMQNIAKGLSNKKLGTDDGDSCSGDKLRYIKEVSNDEIGGSAKAYNKLLDALIKSREVESVFNQFSIVMSENLDLAKLSDKTLLLLIQSTNFEAGAILVTHKGKLLVISSHGILDAESLAKHDVVLQALNESRNIKITLPSKIKLDGVLTQFRPSEVFIEPLEFKGVVSGVLVAATGADLADERTEQLVHLFSRSIGLAINNAVIHAKFQKLAAIDGLTAIYNRRFGMERLKEDFNRAIRDRSSMSIAMVDIDHFKSVNDNYGHLVGDNVIKLVVAVIKDVLRKGDIVIRYGGEEFLMILHGASVKNATSICERIRNQVMDTKYRSNKQDIAVTVSIGLVSFPDESVDDEIQLIHKADQALYFAKESGRNQVIVYGESIKDSG